MGSKRPHDEVEAKGAPAPAPDAAPKAKKRKGFRVGPENLPDGPWRRRNTKIKHELVHKAKVKKDYAKVKAELLKEKAKQDKKGGDDASSAAAAGPTEPQIHPDRLQRIDTEQNEMQHVNPARQALVEGVSGSRPRQARREETAPAKSQQETVPTEQEAGSTAAEPKPATTTTATTEGAAAAAPTPQPQPHPADAHPRRERRKRRPDYYDKALKEGARKKAEAEARAAKAAKAQEERARSIAERERMRRAMLKAKGFSASGRRQGRPKLGRESKVLLDKVKKMVGSSVA